jgi:hypothetical protein
MEGSGVSKIAVGAIALSIAAMNHKGPVVIGWADVVALSVFGVLLWLLLRKRRDAGSDAEAHQEPGQSFAFRLGKSLNRVRRGLSGRA